MTKNVTMPTGYKEWIAELKERVRQAQVRAALAVNSELITLYWQIGRDILERQEQQGWGKSVIPRLSADLKSEFPSIKGFSPRNLGYMKALAETWPSSEILQRVIAKLPWGHNIDLIDKLSDAETRLWYAQAAIENGWSRNVLVHQIETEAHKRFGNAITSFAQTLPSPQSELAQQLIKNPYHFDFLDLGKDAKERDLESGLIEHLKSFLVELGKGFSLVGRQYHLSVGGQDYYIDLLFYHLKLRCFVVIDLKITEFTPEQAGKMNFYLAAVDDLVREDYMNPSIGLILVKEHNHVVVKYALSNVQKPIGVAEYVVRAAQTLGLPLEEVAEVLPSDDQIDEALSENVILFKEKR